MSERYAKEIDDLREWFRLRLPVCGKIKLSHDEWKAGVDSLKGLHVDLVRGSFIEWLAIRKYELSYNQTCVAFFAAADDCNLLDANRWGEETEGKEMNNEQLKALLVIAENASKQSPTPLVHIDAEACVELVREVLEARRLKRPIIVADLTLDEHNGGQA